MHVIAGKAVALKEAMEPEFKTYQQQVAKNAKAMVEVFLERGYKVVSGGTDNHLFLVDLVDKNLTGKEADAALGRTERSEEPVCDLRYSRGYSGDYASRLQRSRSERTGGLDV